MDLPLGGPVGVQGDWAEPRDNTASAKNWIGVGNGKILCVCDAFRNAVALLLPCCAGVTDASD